MEETFYFLWVQYVLLLIINNIACREEAAKWQARFTPWPLTPADTFCGPGMTGAPFSPSQWTWPQANWPRLTGTGHLLSWGGSNGIVTFPWQLCHTELSALKYTALWYLQFNTPMMITVGWNLLGVYFEQKEAEKIIFELSQSLLAKVVFVESRTECQGRRGWGWGDFKCKWRVQMRQAVPTNFIRHLLTRCTFCFKENYVSFLFGRQLFCHKNVCGHCNLVWSSLRQ